MSIYALEGKQLLAIKPTSFVIESIFERDDLQEAFKNNIDIIAPDCMVIAEEFSDWQGSRKRIDLLAIDKQANLVVIELKRTETGDHMELQALRYASMISTMTFDDAIEILQKYKQRNGYPNYSSNDAELEIRAFIENDIVETGFAEDVKTILVSQDFSAELTTSVIWLNERNLDITCMKIQPYNDNGKILIDVQQIIPLPEAEDYQIKVRRKLEEKRDIRKDSSRDYSKYRFNDMELGKGRLALEVFKYYFDQNRNQSIDMVMSEFNDITHSQPIIENLEVAQKHARDKGRARYFLNDDEILRAGNGSQYVVSSQWGKANIKELIELATDTLGYEIEKILTPDCPVKRKVSIEGYDIIQLEDLTVLVNENGTTVNAKPVLRKLCNKLNIELDSGSGNQKNTRSLGNEILNAIERS
ncbi:hypothetical protein [Psychrobacter nivimaris]|uniref:hypothetical protein n=1 Tax=Psychrobacter nivimaris TaxID=281738 RepID=UPI003734FA59